MSTLTDSRLEALYKIFGTRIVQASGDNGFRVQPENPLTAATLFRVCEALGCTPDELFWNPDLDYSGCYYAGDTPEQWIEFEIRRR